MNRSVVDFSPAVGLCPLSLSKKKKKSVYWLSMFNWLLLFVPQFYRCFLILFHCKHQLTENGQSTMPSKTTVVQLNRRVCDSSPAATGHAAATGPMLITGPATPDMEGTSAGNKTDGAEPLEISSWWLKTEGVGPIHCPAPTVVHHCGAASWKLMCAWCHPRCDPSVQWFYHLKTSTLWRPISWLKVRRTNCVNTELVIKNTLNSSGVQTDCNVGVCRYMDEYV